MTLLALKQGKILGMGGSARLTSGFQAFWLFADSVVLTFLPPGWREKARELGTIPR
jgi:hypothetical protein